MSILLALLILFIVFRVGAFFAGMAWALICNVFGFLWSPWGFLGCLTVAALVLYK